MGRESLVTNTILVIFIIIFCGVFTVLLAQWHRDTHHHHLKDDSEDVSKFVVGDICSDCTSSESFTSTSSESFSSIYSKNRRNEELFCKADFALVIWITNRHGSETSGRQLPSRTTSLNHIHFHVLKTFKDSQQKKTDNEWREGENRRRRERKDSREEEIRGEGRERRSLQKMLLKRIRRDVMIVNSSQACNMNFEESSAYFVTGKYMVPSINGTILSIKNSREREEKEREEKEEEKSIMVVSSCDLVFKWSDLSMEKRQDIMDYFKSPNLCS